MIYSEAAILTKFRLLEFDVNLFSIENIAEDEVETNEIEGINERGPLQWRDDGMDAIIDHLREADIAQDNGEKFAGDIKGEGIDAKDVEERCPTGFLLNINDIHEESLQQRGQTTGHHHIAGTPDALVEGQTVREQVTANDKNRAHHEEGYHLIANDLFLTDEFSTIEAQQHMGNGRDGAQESLGINRTLMIEVVVAEEVQVDLRQDIDTRILGIAVAQNEDRGIDHEEANDNGDGVLMIAEEGEERHDAVTEGNALHDSKDAQMSEAQEIALDGVVEPVDKQAYRKQQYGSFDNTSDNGSCGFEFRLHQ